MTTSIIGFHSKTNVVDAVQLRMDVLSSLKTGLGATNTPELQFSVDKLSINGKYQTQE